MDFRLSDEQRLLSESARDLLRRHCPPSHVKEVEREAPFYDAALWRRAGDLGWLELAGEPGSTVDTALLCEELGRASAPLPFLSTALVVRAMARGGGDAAQHWLPRLRSAQAIGAVALTESSARFDASGIAARAHPDGDGLRIDGEKAFVADGVAADVLLVAARCGNGSGEGVALFVVDAAAEGIERRAMATGPGLPLATVVLEGVRVERGAMVAPPEDEEASLHALRDDAAVLGAALMLGHAAQAFEDTLAYAKSREQFGVAIGSFQAVQHRLADMATDVETLRVLVHAAAWKAAAAEPDAELAIATAKAWGAEALERVVGGAHQLFAGIGFTDDHDIQLHTRRAPWYASMYGDTRGHYRRAATLLGL